MKIKSSLLIFALIVLVAVVGYYIGGSIRGPNSDQQSFHTPVIKTENAIPHQRVTNETTNRRKTTISNISKMNTKQIEAIEAKFERKKQEIEEYYADQFRQLQQKVETTLKEYDAADRAAYARFTEQLKNTISISSGYSRISGYVSPYGSVSAHGYYDGTTYTRVAGAPSAAYGRHVQGMNKAVDNLMNEYELEFEHLQRRRACDLDDLEKEKKLALAAVRSQIASQSVQPVSSTGHGIVTGILYNEGSPLIVIDGEIVRESQSIYGVKVVKINHDSVEFEKSGVRWSQRVNEPSSANWP
jgi:hypothetical protein